MIVVDSSLLVSAVVHDDGLAFKVRSLLAEDPDWHAPEHVRVETTSAIRGRLLGGKITRERAEGGLRILSQMEIACAPWWEIADRVWELRDNMNPYDAALIALAEIRGCPVVTLDRTLADCPIRLCSVEVIQ